jgi:hypothetical protein
MPKKVTNTKKPSRDGDFSESLGKIDLSTVNNKATRVLAVVPDEIHDQHTFSVRWPLVTFEKDGIYRSSKFHLCDNSISWIVTLSTVEVDENQMFLSCHLINMSHEHVKAAYSITIINQINDEHFCWTDPEGVVSFSKIADGNNEWGNMELISLDELEQTEGLILNNRLILKIDVYVHDRADLNAHNTLVAEIEKINDAAELVKLANEDLHEVISKLPQSRNIRAQKQQEDKIVRIRGLK